MNHPHQVHHGHKHGHHAHPHKKKKKKIKIFHPKKPWIVAAMIALTIGMGIGENYIESELEPIVALKISQNFQAASFSPSDTTKRGVMRAQYRVSFLSASSINPLDKDEVEPIKEGIKRVCFWQDDIEEPVYSAEVTEVRLTENINSGDEFRVEIKH